ncbi:hypothetical protein EV356DRAFT_449217, partial [Viridothelium virens]
LTTLVLLALGIVSTCARFCIRVYVHHEFGIDDGFLLLGLCSVVVANALLLTVADSMYMDEATLLGLNAVPPDDFLERIYYYQKIIVVSQILAWLAVSSVKMSFLALFKKLVDPIPGLVLYWRVVLMFNIVVIVYGISVWFLSCPHFHSIKSIQCEYGEDLKNAVSYTISQMVLDIFGDFMILIIPAYLIWRIRIRWTQKVALACSLCLTIVTIVFTVVRAVGMQYHGKLDAIWVNFWQLTAAEVGIILTAITAFRVLFVARRKAQEDRERDIE